MQALAWGAPAEGATSEEYVQHMQAGSAAEERGDCRTAGEEYEAAYASTSNHENRYFAVGAAKSCYEKLWETERDPGLLRREQEMLEDFLGREYEGVLEAADIRELERVLEKVNRRIEDLERGNDPDVEAPAVGADPEALDQPTITRPELRPEPRPPAADPMASAPSQRRDRLGIGLLVGGGAATLLGVIPVAIGAATPARAEADFELAVATGRNTEEQRAGYLADNRARANALVISGAVVMSVGAVVAIVGGTRLLRRRTSTTARFLGFRSLAVRTEVSRHLWGRASP